MVLRQKVRNALSVRCHGGISRVNAMDARNALLVPEINAKPVSGPLEQPELASETKQDGQKPPERISRRIIF
jgi:hypothetical protein